MARALISDPRGPQGLNCVSLHCYGLVNTKTRYEKFPIDLYSAVIEVGL